MLLTYFYLLYLFTLSYVYLVTVQVSTKGSPKVDVILWWIQTLTCRLYVVYVALSDLIHSMISWFSKWQKHIQFQDTYKASLTTHCTTPSVTQSCPSVQSSARFCIFPFPFFTASLIKLNHISNLTALGRKSWVLLI